MKREEEFFVCTDICMLYVEAGMNLLYFWACSSERESKNAIQINFNFSGIQETRNNLLYTQTHTHTHKLWCRWNKKKMRMKKAPKWHHLNFFFQFQVIQLNMKEFLPCVEILCVSPFVGFLLMSSSCICIHTCFCAPFLFLMNEFSENELK